MDNYAHEIPKEENDLRLFLINLYDGVCPICNKRKAEGIYNGFVPDKFNIEKVIYLCDECGVVAREEIEGLSRQLANAQRMYNTFVMVLNMLQNKE